MEGEEEEEMAASSAGSLVTSPGSVLRVEAEDGGVVGDKGKLTGNTASLFYYPTNVLFYQVCYWRIMFKQLYLITTFRY